MRERAEEGHHGGDGDDADHGVRSCFDGMGREGRRRAYWMRTTFATLGTPFPSMAKSIQGPGSSVPGSVGSRNW